MSTEYFQRRQHILIDKLAKENLDGMIVTNLTHIRYLCGFTGSSATLLIFSHPILKLHFEYQTFFHILPILIFNRFKL